MARFCGGRSQRQEKKECLVDWFRMQRIEGEPLSRNLAEAMATLIRLPGAQRGGCEAGQRAGFPQNQPSAVWRRDGHYVHVLHGDPEGS